MGTFSFREAANHRSPGAFSRLAEKSSAEVCCSSDGVTRSLQKHAASSGQRRLVLINKHYLKHLSGPVKYPQCGSVAPPTQGIEYLIIVLTE